MLQALHHPAVPATASTALNERSYGQLEGQPYRENWDDKTPPGGETPAQAEARVIPYFDEHIRPELAAGKNVLVVAHYEPVQILQRHVTGDEAAEPQNAVPEAYFFGPGGTLLSHTTVPLAGTR
jgi:2,3-bisphosphoglycerate-dependent phosphoglycerate mutase